MTSQIMNDDKKKFYNSLFFPLVFLVAIWIVKISEDTFNLDLASLGIYPLKFSGLKGILFAPLIHGSYSHLISNSVPLVILGVAIFYFYKEVAFKVFFLSWFMAGLWVWMGARPSYHIGASGLIYSLASFLFFSGVIRKQPRLSAISLIVVFLYGSMIWGIFPIIPDVSWESHLLGGIAGLFLAFYYRNYGPQRERFDWELEPDDEDEDNDYEIENAELNSNSNVDDNNIEINQ